MSWRDSTKKSMFRFTIVASESLKPLLNSLLSVLHDSCRGISIVCVPFTIDDNNECHHRHIHLLTLFRKKYEIRVTLPLYKVSL